VDRINVTKSFLPPLEEYQVYLEQIWDRAQLTNQGPLLLELEARLKDLLGVDNLHFVTNGTLALQITIRALNFSEGEIITTPFSYVATTSSILWEGHKPVFVDIKPETLCIDASKIEAAITKKTRAIMAVHVFGFPCEVEQIEAIAKKHNLKVIYDGAHAFGVIHKNKSLLSYGDITMCSFHATKLFHTIEGGAAITGDKSLSDKIELIKRFGHDGDNHESLGINAKASEFQAAMGLCNLKYIDQIISKRKATAEYYDQLLDSRFERPVIGSETQRNYAYYPVLFKNEKELLNAFTRLNNQNIFPRRYFYPSLNNLPYVDNTSCPISEDISSRIACLPLYSDLREEVVEKIANIVNET
jgi:dTDP-4-amino-4,6-dideoxygalactose transaminase